MLGLGLTPSRKHIGRNHKGILNFKSWSHNALTDAYHLYTL